MKKIIGGRGTGKSTELIRRSADTGKYIVVSTKRRAEHLFKQAKDMGITIPYPVTWDEIKTRNKKVELNCSYGSLSLGILIDDVEDLLRHIFIGIPIEGMTLMNNDVHILSNRVDWSKCDSIDANEFNKSLLAMIDRVDEMKG